MPDIQMCSAITNGIKCPIRNKCHRFTAKPSEYNQAYGPVGDGFTAERGCVDFIDNLKGGQYEQVK